MFRQNILRGCSSTLLLKLFFFSFNSSSRHAEVNQKMVKEGKKDERRKKGRNSWQHETIKKIEGSTKKFVVAKLF